MHKKLILVFIQTLTCRPTCLIASKILDGEKYVWNGPFQALKCPSYQGGDSDTLGHNNPRGQVHFQEREENELSMARLFLETGV